MRGIKGSLLAVSFLLAAGCATRSDLGAVQNDMEEMKTRLFRMEKDMGGLRSEARENMEKKVKEFQTDSESSRKTLADLQASMDSVRVDMNVMTGKMDDLGNQLKKPGEDIALLREDLERRLKALDERIVKSEKGLEEMRAKMAAEPVKQKEPEKTTPEAIYQKGLDAYKGGNLKESRDILGKFLEANPKHDLAANARYWLGETYYSEKNFEQAILEFQEVIKNYPGNGKVAAAMYKQALAFKEIGDSKSAKYVLKKLTEDHPASEEAKKAKDKLKELK